MKQLVDALNYHTGVRKITDIIMLPYGWDGNKAPEGSSYPTVKALSIFKKLLEQKIPMPMISVTIHGAIHFSWTEPNHVCLELLWSQINMITSFNDLRAFRKEKFSYEDTDYMLEVVKGWLKEERRVFEDVISLHKHF